MANTLVGPGVLRDTHDYPSTTEGSIMIGRNPSSSSNSNASNPPRHHRASRQDAGLFGSITSFLASPPSSLGARFRRSYFGQFIILMGVLSLLVFLQDAWISLSGENTVKPAVMVGREQDVGRASEKLKIVQDPQQQQEKRPNGEAENRSDKQSQVDEIIAAAMAANMGEYDDDEASLPDIDENISSDDENSNYSLKTSMRQKTEEWMRSFANIIIGHESDEMTDDDYEKEEEEEEELGVFIPKAKQQGQFAEVVSVPQVMDVLGEESTPKYESLPDSSSTFDSSIDNNESNDDILNSLHEKYHWTSSSIQKALDPNQSDIDPPRRQRPQDNGDELSKVSILQWQQEQELTQCQVRNDGYEHEIDNLRHQIDEQDSDLRDLRKQVEDLKTLLVDLDADIE
ncbi:hypothetical protein FBU30_004074 [Linnemannia zychae]|nr:hypothetical protein FBU30_004074 [Linnemannia zychae]